MVTKEKLVPALIGGVLVGFAFGIGYILANRLLTKKGSSQTSDITPIKEAVVKNPKYVNESNLAMKEYAGFNETGFALDNHPMDALIQAPQTQKPARTFDFTTGKSW